MEPQYDDDIREPFEDDDQPVYSSGNGYLKTSPRRIDEIQWYTSGFC